ncbi:NAD(P)H-binding protein [Streptomyces sp. NPDC052727]|uniref:NAD(P)-dependent oxidoreductase n=1 Tax=unclassified Streptomyces TaxID=2593676 RepID=UPI003448BF70
MKILLLGATGMVGSAIAAEAAARGHDVTCVSRSGEAPVPGVTSIAADATDGSRVAALAAGHDAMASALVPLRDGSDPKEPFLALNRALVEAARTAHVSRMVVVGGAGSLEVAPGEALADQPGFPAEILGEALAHRDVLAFFRTVDDLDWTYVSPAAEITSGERSGNYRVGGDQLLSDDEGRSRIGIGDYAAAFMDELESNAHPRTRISVAY